MHFAAIKSEKWADVETLSSPRIGTPDTPETRMGARENSFSKEEPPIGGVGISVTHFVGADHIFT